MRRPYVWTCDNENAMHMIRHDDPGVYFHLEEMGGDFLPHPMRHPPAIVQLHLSVHDFAEYTGSVSGADGHKIRPLLGIIEPWET